MSERRSYLLSHFTYGLTGLKCEVITDKTIYDLQHATTENFPPLRRILTRLLFKPVEGYPSPSSSRPSTPELGPVAAPVETYYGLPPEDRIAILSFLCNLAVSSKAIHGYMETCEEQLTALRKEKIEVNRSKKQLYVFSPALTSVGRSADLLVILASKSATHSSQRRKAKSQRQTGTAAPTASQPPILQPHHTTLPPTFPISPPPKTARTSLPPHLSNPPDRKTTSISCARPNLKRTPNNEKLHDYALHRSNKPKPNVDGSMRR